MSDREHWGRQVEFANDDRAVGDYDLNTFLIRADLLGDTETLPLGMSVWMRQHW